MQKQALGRNRWSPVRCTHPSQVTARALGSITKRYLDHCNSWRRPSLPSISSILFPNQEFQSVKFLNEVLQWISFHSNTWWKEMRPLHLKLWESQAPFQWGRIWTWTDARISFNDRIFFIVNRVTMVAYCHPYLDVGVILFTPLSLQGCWQEPRLGAFLFCLKKKS